MSKDILRNSGRSACPCAFGRGGDSLQRNSESAGKFVSTSQDIDFDGNGPQFRIDYQLHYDSYVYYLGINELTANAQHIKGTYNPIVYYHNDALNLPSNYQIGANLANSPRAQWYHGGGMPIRLTGRSHIMSGPTTDSMGNFNNATGYIGVRFQTQCGLAYGWIHYQGVTSNREYRNRHHHRLGI